MEISFDRKTFIKYLTSPLSASLIITLIVGILYLCISGMTGFIKMIFWTFIFVLVIIYLNNEYLFTQFEEKKIPGDFPIIDTKIKKNNLDNEN